jgi:hypothetical protein
MAKLLTGTRIYGTATVDTQLFVSGTNVASSTITGALQVVGGVGIGGTGYFGGNVTAPTFIGNLTGVATTSTNLASGAVGSLPYQSTTGTTTFLSIGTTGFVLTSNGTAPTWSAISGLSAGNATTATNLAGGTQGQVPYQTNTGTTSFFGPGTAGNVLVSNGTSAPTYQNTLTLAGTTAATSTNTGALQVTGGVGVGGGVYVGGTVTATSITVTSLNGFNGPSTGRITFGGPVSPTIIYADPYQILLQPGNSGNAVTVNPAGRASTSTTTGALVIDGGVGVGGAGYFGGNLYVTGDIVANKLTIQLTTVTTTLITTDDIISTYNTTAATSTNTGALQVAGGVGIGGNVFIGGTVTATLHVGNLTGTATTATNLASGLSGSLPYQSATGTTSMLSLGTSGYVLTAGATAPQWTSISGLTAGSATTATNLAAGTPGQVPYQTAAGATSFITTAATGYILSSNGTSAPSYIAQSSLSVGTSTQVQTISQNANASYYPTFVSANNASATGMSVYTTSSFVINPSTSQMLVGSNTFPTSVQTFTIASDDATLGGAQLHITGATTSTYRLRLGYNTVGNYGNIQSVNFGVAYTPLVLNIAGLSASPVLIGTSTQASGEKLGVAGGAYINGTFTATGVSYFGSNVGVGTTTPATYGTFVVSHVGSSTTGIVVGDTTTPANATGIYLRSTTTASIAWASGASLIFTQGAGGTERLRITANGGIAFGGGANYGTSGQILQSNGDAAPTWVTLSTGLATTATNVVITADTSTTTPQYITFVSTTTGSSGIKTSSISGLNFIASSGYHGIGITTPTAPLHVVSSANGVIKFTGNTTGQQGVLYSDATKISLTDSTSADAFSISPGSALLTLTTNAVDRVTVDSAGQVKIIVGTASTSTSTGALIVNGGVGIGGSVNIGTGNNTITTATWEKWKLVTVGTTAAARQGSDSNGLNFTSNALWTGSAWSEDDITKKKFAYIQHLGNGRHEFRSAATGTGITWVTGLTLDDTASTFTVPLSITSTTAASSTITGALIVSGGVGIGGNLYVGGSLNLTSALTVPNGGTGVATLTGVAYGNGTSAFTAATGAQISTALSTTNISGNAANVTGVVATNNGGTGLSSWTAGDIAYYASGTALTKLALGASGYVLTAGASAPQWTALSGVSAGSATNIAGGLANQIPFQTGASLTSFSSNLTWNTGTSTLGATGTITATGSLKRSGNISSAAWTTTSPMFDSGVSVLTDTSAAAGTVAAKVAISFDNPYFASTNIITVTDAVNLFVKSPQASTNVTFTNSWGIYNQGSSFVGASEKITTSLAVGSYSVTANTGDILASGNGMFGYSTAQSSARLSVSGAAYINGTTTVTSGLYVTGGLNSFVASGTTLGTMAQLKNSTNGGNTVFYGVGSAGVGSWGDGSQIMEFNPVGPANSSFISAYTGSLIFQTNNRTVALTITNTGAVAFGASQTAYGSSGQVLKSNGNAAPTWIDQSSVIGGGSDSLKTIQQTASGTYYPTFVNSNPATASYLAYYTTSSFSINPSTGAVGINGVGGTALNISVPSTVTDRYFINATAAVNSFSIYDNGNTPYINSYAGMSFRANQIGGTGGLINFTGGNVYVGSNLGIGTPSPNRKLHVQSGGAAIQLFDASSNGGTGIFFAGASTLRNWFIGNQYNVSDVLEFTPSAAVGTTTIGTTPVMVIQSNGNVGIGTTTPPNKLTVSNGGAVGLEITPTGGYTTLGGVDFLAYNRASSAYAPIGFVTNSNNNSMVILTSGNVGIGTTGPRSKFESVTGANGVNTNADAPGSAGAFVGPTGTGQGSQLSIESNDAIAANTGGVLAFGGRYSGTALATWAGIKGLKEDGTSGNYGGYLSFYTRTHGAAMPERMRITPAGNVVIGATTTINKFEVAGTLGQLFSVSDSMSGTIFSANDISGIPSIEVVDTGLVKLAQYNGQVTISTGTAVSGSVLTVYGIISTVGTGGEIRASSEITAYYTSDERLKENIKLIVDPVGMLKQVRGVYFDWIDEHIQSRGGEDGYFVRKEDVGVIAQEIEKILPEAVGTRENGYKAVRYEKLVPVLIEAVKSQQAEIDTLKYEMAEIKKWIASQQN